MNRIERLTAILTHLQVKRTTRAQEIADRFGISLRTVYRDIRALEESGVPILGEAGIGYSLVEGYRLPPVMFSQEEAMAMLLAEKLVPKMADKITGQHLQTAITKIRSVLKSTEKQTLSEIDPQIAVLKNLNVLMEEGRDDLLQKILSSLSRQTLLEVVYTTFEKEETTNRVLEPVGVYYSHDMWYLIAWCRLRKDYRTFRLDRFQQVRVLEEQFAAVHPSLQDYLNMVAERENLCRVVLMVPHESAKYMRVQKYNLGFVAERILDQGIEMTFMTSSLEGFARWTMMMADKIHILEPISLREMLLELLREMLQNQTLGLPLVKSE